MMTVKAMKKAALEKQMAHYFEQYNAANEQLLIELNAANKVTLHNQIDQLYQQMSAVEAELQILEAESRPASQRVADLQAHVHKIDFQEALTLFRQTLATVDQDGGAAAFLVQQSLALGGEWFLQHVKACLAERTRNLKTHTIGFSVGASPDEFSLIRRLADYFGVPAQAASSEQTANQIIETLCGSVRTGDVVLLEFHHWDQIAEPAHVLRVFWRHFWAPLVQRMETVLQQWERVKVIAFLTAGGPLAPQCWSSDVFCTPEQLCPDKVLEIPLRLWTCQEIQQWLHDFSDFKTPQIQQLAHYIYTTSQNGLPCLVYDHILKL